MSPSCGWRRISPRDCGGATLLYNTVTYVRKSVQIFRRRKQSAAAASDRKSDAGELTCFLQPSLCEGWAWGERLQPIGPLRHPLQPDTAPQFLQVCFSQLRFIQSALSDELWLRWFTLNNS